MKKITYSNLWEMIFRDLSHGSHADVALFNKEWRAVA